MSLAFAVIDPIPTFSSEPTQPSAAEKYSDGLPAKLPKTPMAAFYMYRRKDYNGAIEALTPALEKRPDAVPWLELRGLSYKKLGKLADAVDDLRRVCELSNYSRAAAAVQVAQAYFQLGHYDNAVAVADKYQGSPDASGDLWCIKSMVFARLGEASAAKNALDYAKLLGADQSFLIEAGDELAKPGNH